MKPSTVFCALIGISLSAQLLYAHGVAENNEQPAKSVEKIPSISGMFFSSDNVVEEYEYDDAYCILYDDADANMFNVEICVDLETYQAVINAHETNCTLVGTLITNDDYSFDCLEVLTYMPDSEFEMAQAREKF